jgi:hypothetical protein
MARAASAASASVATARRWRERLARWRRAGLSVCEFCRREGISEPSFYQWRRRLQPRPAHGEAPRFVELPAWSAVSGTVAGARTVTGTGPGSVAGTGTVAGTAVQVALPSGAVVTIPVQASPQVIEAVIRAALAPAGESPRC